LVVGGCYWACPYETRFYDFSNPMAGWPQLKCKECMEDDIRPPVIEVNEFNTLVKCFKTRYIDDDEEDDDDNHPKSAELPPVDITMTFRRNGNELILIHEEISQYEADRIEGNRIANERYDAWKADYRANDPLYLIFKEQLNNPVLAPESYDSVGQVYDNWIEAYKPTQIERRWCRRLTNKDKNNGKYNIEISWGVDVSPIKLTIYKDSVKLPDQVFTHSVEGMNDAFKYVINLLTA
jgi:hypothetical protein